MKFKLGDFVRFVDEKREGYVTKIIDAQTLGVTDEDGFEIPVAISNLTSVHGHGITAEEQDAPKPIQVSVPTISKIENGIYVAVATDNKAGNVVHFHLQNQSSSVLLMSLTTERKEKYTGAFHGIIEAYQSALVYSASLADLDLWPEFTFQILISGKTDAKPVDPLVIRKKFRAKDFSSEQKELPMAKNKGWLIRLDDLVPITIDAQKLRESFFKSPAEKKTVDAPAKEIDLHIEKLRDDHHFLEPDEILQIQINHFQNSLDAAIVHHFDKMIFIHGSGNGTLRDKIHKLISKNPHIKTYMDARKEKFGYGATEVVFK
ncbi:Smr domain-containing protein [Pedobacter psychrotolerans]|uniref:Mannonate oxidoreductase n=1 Tax=Pedobacter psychrotolerans TaxID=1843235 RepID=A0A4R2H9M7_9SPHI|nr:Smr/MutS family protein [Pedobacter psychrotolerans]TCO23787.1 Smr domain-containing protein [Pedobacter psychrotolerans]GGE62607.1 mannonate oxidoreductase [Pedobacter psychrotolerans]